MKPRYMTALGLSAVLMLAGCGSSGEEPAAASGGVVSADDCADPAGAKAKINGTLKVGWSGATSGPLAQAVGLVIDGMRTRFAVANEAGGINGVKLEVIVKDDAFSPERAKTNVNEMIQKDKVHVLETFGSGQLNAVSDDQNEACVPLLFAQASVPAYRDAKNFPWTTEYLPSADIEMTAVVEQIKKKYPNGVDVALAANQTESGQGYANAFKSAVKGTNIKIVKEAPSTDPNAAMTTLKVSGAKVLVNAVVTGDCLPLTQALGRSDWKPEAVFQPSNCVDGKMLYEPAGEAADGQQIMVWLKDPGNKIYADDPGVKQYLEGAKKHGNKHPMNNYTVNGWAIGDLMVDAFTKAAQSGDGLSRIGIMKSARTQSYQPPMFIDGVKWTMTPEKSLGIVAFRPFAWNAKKKTFEPTGDVIDMSNR